MAIEKLFKEINNLLATYDSRDYNEYVEEQSKYHTTRVWYYDTWTTGVLVETLEKHLLKSGMNKKQIESNRVDINKAASLAIREKNTLSNWQTELNTYYDVVTQKPEIIQKGKSYVQVEPHGYNMELIFYNSYKAKEANQSHDNHYKAQGQVFMGAGALLIANLKKAGFGKDPSSPINSFKGTKFMGGGVRLHGGSPYDKDNRSDTSARLIHFLEKMKGADFAERTRGGQAVAPAVIQQINQRFNAAYKINGLKKINLFNSDSIATDQVDIKIVFGTASQNELMSMADKGKSVVGDKSLDGFFKTLENTLIQKFKNPKTPGSLSLLEMTERGVFAKIPAAMKKASGLPDLRFKINKELIKKAKYEEKQKKKAALELRRQSTKVMKTINKKGGKMKAGRARTKDTAKTAQSPLHLQAMLEALLPQVVASKMGTGGALRYQTGRFANSVEPTQVMVGPRGGVHVDYTYMKYPYQTFEPGFKQGSTARDPRKIIGESVREIAQSIIGNKFLKVRRV